MRIHCRLKLTLLALLCVAMRIDSAQAQMDYRDEAELEQILQTFANGSRHAQLFTIGYGIDYKTDAFPRSHRIYALRISASRDETIEDDYRKNSILFEAGMHSREWLATESCLVLAEYLVENAENSSSGIPELLAHVDVWIVPSSNPSGRVIDDKDGGNPTAFSTNPSSAGWRGNGDVRDCNYGVDIARNFSQDWNDASSECGSKYRGFAPFSTMEATALREFVQNHGISMAVVIHSNAEKIWNIWGTNDVAGGSLSNWAELAWRTYTLDNPNLTLEIKPVGTGIGQFSAWLADTSDSTYQTHGTTYNEPDNGSVRAIQTIFVELPFLMEDAGDVTPPEAPERNYVGAYRHRNNDSSNGFHPSGEHVLDLVRRNFIVMAKELIYEGRAPGCPSLGSCPDRDFGLVGAKIDKYQLKKGKLISYPALRNNDTIIRARDYLGVGTYYLDYRVQNFSKKTDSKDVDVQIKVIRDRVQVNSSIVPFRGLTLRQLRTGRFTLNIDRSDADYTVSLEARPAGGFGSNVKDNFTKNDKKVFKFRSGQP